MSVLLVGANPGLALHTASGELVAFASVWLVDWSTHGPGRALVLWGAGKTRVVTEQPELGRWLAEAFTRHFPEVDGVPWPAPEVTVAPVRVELDPATGVRAEADDVLLEITEPLDRRRSDVAAFPGNGLRLTNVYVPCRRGVLRIAGRPVDGVPRVSEGARPSSSAFLADAEVWSAG